MKVVVAPQEFKGSLSASEAAAAMAEGVRGALAQAVIIALPMADGGPGTVAAVVAGGGRLLRAAARDPLGRPVEAEWALVGGETAVIEMAQAAGLWRLAPQERDPGATSTYGVGELIRVAMDAGCRHLIVGLGGSATNDGGAGMVQALGGRFLDERGEELPRPCRGAALARLHRIDVSALDGRLRQCRVTAATDVSNPLCGPEGASLVYSPQKGATPEMAQELEAALRHYAEVIERDTGARIVDTAGAGAAGGLGAGLIAFLNASVRPGADLVAEVMGLGEALADADLVLTGEGQLDAQTAYGKTVSGVVRLARQGGVPVIAIVGSLGPGWHTLLSQGLDGVEAMVGGSFGLEEAMRRAPELLARTTERAVRDWLRVQAIGGT
ncbi:MAG: glycerate kinase [Dehalococcoidia bacterium]